MFIRLEDVVYLYAPKLKLDLGYRPLLRVWTLLPPLNFEPGYGPRPVIYFQEIRLALMTYLCISACIHSY